MYRYTYICISMDVPRIVHKSLKNVLLFKTTLNQHCVKDICIILYIRCFDEGSNTISASSILLSSKAYIN